MTYTRSTISKELAEQLVSEHGSQSAAAAAIHSQCRDQFGGKPTHNAVRQWINEALSGSLVPRTKQIYDPEEADKLNQIKNLLDEANVPIDAIDKIDHVKIKSGYHEVVTKDAEGEPQITRSSAKNVSLVLSPKWADGPEWPVVQPGKPVIVKPTPREKKKDRCKTVVVISDTQIGFLRDIEDPSQLVPIHDPYAIEVALKIVAEVQPDQIGYVGDYLDLPEMSRWLQHEEFWRTTQPAIDEGYKILARFEAAAGPREEREPTQFVAGNHDRRLREYALKNARAAFGLRPAHETPATWPDLSIPHLLRFEELGIEYCGEYPGGEWWITPKLVVRHNPESPDAYMATVIAGHTHAIQSLSYSRRTPQGPVFYDRHEIGCLASLENYPDKKSLMATRVPSGRGFVKNWRHGIAIVYVDENEDFHVEPIRFISNRKAIYAGKTFEA